MRLIRRRDPKREFSEPITASSLAHRGPLFTSLPDASTPSATAPLPGAAIAATAQNETRFLSDEDVWVAFQSGEDAAFSMLYARFGDRLYAYLKFLLAQTPRHSDDVFQETWITVFKERHEFLATGPGSFSSWLFRLAHNLAISQVRREHKMIGIDDLEVDSELIEGFVVEAAQEAFGTPNAEEMMLQVAFAVESLPIMLREVFVLSEFDHLTLEQIADTIGISRSNAKVRLFRARRVIREQLEKMLDLS